MSAVGRSPETYASQSAMHYAACPTGVNRTQCNVGSSMEIPVNAFSDHHQQQQHVHHHHPETASGHHQDITICINDVTVDSTDDYMVPSGGTDETNADFIEQVKKANKRRSSWCPEEGRKKEEKHEKQKMLNISGRR